MNYDFDFGVFAMDEAGDDDEAAQMDDYPVLPLRDTVVFPQMMAPLTVGRDRSLKAVEAAMEEDNRIIVVAQKDPAVQEPGLDDLYTTGVEMVVGRILRLPDGSTNVLGQGRRRVQILSLSQTRPYLRARVQPLHESNQVTLGTEALMRAVLSLFEKVVELSRTLPEDAYVAAMNLHEPGPLADLIGSLLDLDFRKRQELLELLEPSARLQRLSILLAQELDVLELEYSIHDKVQQEMDRSQREFFLREQMRAIRTELGEIDVQTAEVEELEAKLGTTDMPEEVRGKAEKELARLKAMPSAAPEVAVIRTYLDWLLDLPWSEQSDDNLDIGVVEETLESNHFGLPRPRSGSSNTLLCASCRVASLRGGARSSALSGHPAQARRRWGTQSPRPWAASLCAFPWEVFGTRLRFAVTAAPTSAPCRAHYRTMRNAGTVNPLYARRN